MKLRMLKNFHDNFTTKHFDKNKTLIFWQKWFYWLKINNLIKKYVKTCNTCMKTKLSKHFFHENFLFLSISNRTWFDITVNFVTDLSKSKFYNSNDVFNCIMITIDRFIKITHYSLCVKTMNSKHEILKYISYFT